MMFAWIWLHPRIAAVLLLALLVSLAVTYKHGYDTGKAAVQHEWDKDKLAVQQAIEKEKEADRKAAVEASERFEAKAREMERLNAAQSQQLQVALNRRLVCPKGTTTIGDLIIPVDVARGMFYYETSASGAPASAPARKPRAGLFNWPRTP